MSIRTASDEAARRGYSQGDFMLWLNDNYPDWYTPRPEIKAKRTKLELRADLKLVTQKLEALRLARTARAASKSLTVTGPTWDFGGDEAFA